MQTQMRLRTRNNEVVIIDVNFLQEPLSSPSVITIEVNLGSADYVFSLSRNPLITVGPNRVGRYVDVPAVFIILFRKLEYLIYA